MHLYTLPAHGIRFIWRQVRQTSAEARARGDISLSLISSDPLRDHVSRVWVPIPGRVHCTSSGIPRRTHKVARGGGGPPPLFHPYPPCTLNSRGNLTSSDALEAVLCCCSFPCPHPRDLSSAVLSFRQHGLVDATPTHTMFDFFSTCLLLHAFSLVGASISPISAKGAKLYDDDGHQFFIRGVYGEA